jgi:hypothetical protein
VERELVLRLASLLWGLRRIIAVETDLFLQDHRKEMAQIPGKLSDQESVLVPSMSRVIPDRAQRHHVSVLR